MLVRSAATLAAFAFPALLAAGDFWQDKPASDWSDKDVKRLVTKSPWAKEVEAAFEPGNRRTGMPESGGRGGWRGGGGGEGMGGPPMGGGGMGGPGMGGGGGMGGMGGGSMRGGGMGNPGMEGQGGSGGGMPMPKVNVRWESAEPMQAAANKLEDPAAKSLAEWSKEFYVVTVSGMTMMRRRDQGGEQRQPDPQRMKQLAERLKTVTALKRKGKDDLAPARVEMIQSDGGMVTAFLFPRREAITGEDKEVSFETAMGPMQIKSRFVLKEMMVHGKLEL